MIEKIFTNDWLLKIIQVPRETSKLEFKGAKDQYDINKLKKYCVALANEGGGQIIFGVSDKIPRQILGTRAFANPESTASLILQSLGFRVDAHEIVHDDKKVIVFDIPSRPRGTPYSMAGTYLMRSGEELVPMTEDRLRKIFSEGSPDWLSQFGKIDIDGAEVISLIDTQTFFDLLKIPYPSSQEAVLTKLIGEGLICESNNKYSVSNLGAILLAKNLENWPLELSRKAARVVIYEGIDKLKTKNDMKGKRGYAVGFGPLVDFVHSSAPLNLVVEEVLREEVKMFPKQALRELIANALVHQDFSASGSSIMIEMYIDRVEISNPGIPPIAVDRFIDEYRSRNERLADLMRRMGVCEEKGSGVDKVISAAEAYQLPAPDFRASALRTTAILYAHKDFSDMSRLDRVRACYQHCCLRYVSNQLMTNQSLRERFRLPVSKSATASQIIGATKDAGHILMDQSDTSSTRYARYRPYWA